MKLTEARKAAEKWAGGEWSTAALREAFIAAFLAGSDWQKAQSSNVAANDTSAEPVAETQKERQVPAQDERACLCGRYSCEGCQEEPCFMPRRVAAQDACHIGGGLTACNPNCPHERVETQNDYKVMETDCGCRVVVGPNLSWSCPHGKRHNQQVTKGDAK